MLIRSLGIKDADNPFKRKDHKVIGVHRSVMSSDWSLQAFKDFSKQSNLTINTLTLALTA